MTSQGIRIGVVGGGPAGLTAAHALRRRGARVVVWEAREQVGGRSWTDRLDGVRVDGGAQLLGSMYHRLFGLLEELGRTRELVRSPGRDALWRGGRVHEVVYGSVASMVASGGLPWTTKLRLGTTYVPFLTRHARSLEMHAPERASYAGLDGESIGEWGSREIGRDFVDHLVHPQLAAYYGATPDEASAGFYHILARYGMDVSVFTLRGGIGSFCEGLAARLREDGVELRTGVEVRGVRAGDGEVVVSGEGWEERLDAAVLAVPAPAALRLLPDAPAPLTGWLRAVRFRPALSLALLLDRPLGVRYFGLSFPRGASDRVSAVCVEENKGGDTVPPGRGLLVAFAAPRAAAALVEMEAREILDIMLPELARFLPGIDARVTRARVYRWPEGHAIFYPGYLGRLGAFRGGGIEGDLRIALAGDYLYFPSLEGAVTAGLEAVERLLARLG